MANTADLVGPMAIWIGISLVFGPFQVWMGASKCRRRENPPRPWSECVTISLADGNLFIFAIGTAGSVMAVALMELYRDHGVLHQFKPLGFLLLIVSLLTIVIASVAWTDAKAAQSTSGPAGGKRKPNLAHDLHGLIGERDVRGSVYFASIAFVCALVIEGLRLVEALGPAPKP